MAFHPVLFIFQEIKLRFFLPVNFLNKDILKSWKTCLSYFNCVKTGCAGRERGRGERERREKRWGAGRKEGGEGEGVGGGGEQRENGFKKLKSSSPLK